MTRFALSLVACLVVATTALAQLPQGVVDTQPSGDTPPTPQESLAKISVPDGFSVTLFAGEPDVHQPIAMEFDDRGRRVSRWASVEFGFARHRILFLFQTRIPTTFPMVRM